jgi:hypothetical protein
MGDVLFYLFIVDIIFSFSPGFSFRKTSPRRAAILTPAAPGITSSQFPTLYIQKHEHQDNKGLPESRKRGDVVEIMNFACEWVFGRRQPCLVKSN